MKLTLIILLLFLFTLLSNVASLNTGFKAIQSPKTVKSSPRNSNIQEPQKNSKTLSRKGRNIQSFDQHQWKRGEQYRQKLDRYKRNYDYIISHKPIKKQSIIHSEHIMKNN